MFHELSKMGTKRYDLLAVHVVFLIIYLFTLVYDILYTEIGWQGYGGKFKFLTFLCLLLQTAYFGLSVINDIWGSHVKPSDTTAQKSGLQKFLDIFLSGLCYPVGVFVVMTFWGIYAVDRELVFPKRLDALIPAWQNHVMHTTVLPILFVEKYLVYREYPSKRKGISILMAFALGYLVWILWIAYYADIWVYPILQVMEAHERAIFIMVLMAFFISIYIFGEALNKALWKKEVQSVKSVKRKSTRKTS